MRAAALALLGVGLLLLMPASSAADVPAGPQAVVLVHHPFDQVDPFGIHFGDGDTFSSRYNSFADATGTFPFPTFVADGTEAVLALPRPDRPYQGTLDNYTAIVQRHIAAEAPLALSLQASETGHDLVAGIHLEPVAPLADPSGASHLHLWVAVVEDNIYYKADGPVSNGITNHRFTVRSLQDEGVVDLSSGSAVWHNATVPAASGWNRARLSVAVWVQSDAAFSRFAPHEVLQATQAPLGGSPVHQAKKAVLLEMYSATWCTPCLYGDLAIEQVAIAYGGASNATSPASSKYFEAPTSYTGPGARLPAMLTGQSAAMPMDWVLLLAAVAALGGVAASALDIRSRHARPSAGALWWPTMAALGAGGALLYLASRFLAADLSVQYVFFYTRADLGWQWRLAGTWAGREGSLLLWTASLAVVAAVLGWTHRHGTDDEPLARARAWTRLFLGVGVLMFLLAALQDSPFAPTSPNLLQGRPLGNGLNPTLKSGFILIHPPLMFLAYALAAVPAAAAFGHLASGTARWSTVALAWSRLGWLVMTFALGLGAMWAYYTLGFGGYFAWDPVEVANLLPWLAFTLYLHAQLHHLRHASHARIGPFLAVLPFVFSVFSTLSTRSGLWVSVHAFTDPTDTFNPDAAGRFMDILRVEQSLGFYVGLFVGVLAAFLAMWSHRMGRDVNRWRKLSLFSTVLFVILAVAAFLDPASTFSLLLEAGYRLTGSAGIGLLAFTFIAVALATAPALASNEAPDSDSRQGLQRITLRTLNAYAVGALGLALLVLFLFHMAAVDGWTTEFYEARFPYLAAPVLLGLFVMQGFQAYGRRRTLVFAALALLAAIVVQAAWSGHRGGPFLAVLSAALVVVSVDRVRRAGQAPGIGRRARLADFALWLAAVLDVLFWAAPPTLRLGFAAVEVPFAVGLAACGVAVIALWFATRVLVGAAPRPPVATYILVAVLGGFFIAPLLAAAAWLARAGTLAPARPDHRARARLRQVGLYGAHMAMAIALLGYAASTYGKTQVDTEATLGQPVTLGGATLTFDGMPATPPGRALDTIAPHFTLRHGDAVEGSLSGALHWEPQAEAHFPTPSTLHSWQGDVYLDVEAVHIAAGGNCVGPSHPDGAWIEAYKSGSPSRACSGDTVDRVRLKAVELPGLGLLWLALVLLVFHMGLLLFADRDD